MQVAARSGPGEWFVASTFARSFMALTHQPYASVPWPAEIHGSRSIRAGQNKAAHGLTLFSSPVGASQSAALRPLGSQAGSGAWSPQRIYSEYALCPEEVCPGFTPHLYWLLQPRSPREPKHLWQESQQQATGRYLRSRAARFQRLAGKRSHSWRSGFTEGNRHFCQLNQKVRNL